MKEPEITATDILDALKRIQGILHRTPVMQCITLDKMSGATLYFKCENFQKAGAFKARGAVNAVMCLTEDKLAKGVATHSSGNHAAALAMAAGFRGTEAHIVMPENSSRVKVAAVRNYGGNITFCESNLASREETLLKVLEKTGAVEIHPYNNARIIQGQATAAYELLEDIPELDILLAPVGGGGLLSGTAMAVHHFSQKAIVMAAEPEMASDAYQSFQQKRFIESVDPQTIADGLRTSLGSITYPIISQYVNSIHLATETGIINAMRLIWERMKIIVEPSSAVTLAAILENPVPFHGKKVGIIISGGNVDLSSLPW
ncbi:MAG: pyridoxal-phosphate dependent enzyme [Bacteroidales bacterium]|nr:pyridoxal-phosphate dependent enzyme [Bacteroidales bacterium]